MGDSSMETTKRSRHRLPKKTVGRITRIGYRLDELFFQEELEDLMVIARHRISREFHFATEENPRWKPGSGRRQFRQTDNFIIGVSERPSELASYVLRNMRRSFIQKHQLPKQVRDLPEWLMEKVIAKAHYDVLLGAINAMHANSDIWYDYGLGIWISAQSNLDDFWKFVEKDWADKGTPKFDDRSWHGRPRRDRGTMPEGAAARFA